MGAEVALPRLALGPVAADQAARQDAIGRDADAEFAAGLQDAALDAARDQGIFDLQVGDGMHGRRAAEGFRSHFGQADVAHVARLHEIGDGADGVLDRHGRIQPRGPVDVDVVQAQALQGIGREGLDRFRAAVEAEPGLIRAAQGAELDADLETIAADALHRLGDEHLVVAHAVEVAGVDQIDPGVEGGVDGGDALLPVRGTVHARHAHASETEGRDPGAGLAELKLLHRNYPVLSSARAAIRADMAVTDGMPSGPRPWACMMAAGSR